MTVPYEKDIEVLLPSIYVNEHITETKHSIMVYYGGDIRYVLTLIANTIMRDIRDTIFKAWWPNEEEILAHLDQRNPGVYDHLYNLWNIVNCGRDERRIEWSTVEKIYRDLFIVVWRLYLNVLWNVSLYCYNVAFSETGGRTNQFLLDLVGIALDHANQLTIARIKVTEF